jgi:hypothetical protein
MTEVEKSKQHFNKEQRINRTIALVLMAASFVFGLFLPELISSSSEEDSNPRGSWRKFSVEQNTLHVEFDAVSPDPHTGIDQVDVTIEDANGDWLLVCRLDRAQKTNTYVCDADLTTINPGGQSLEVSVNVYDTKGTVSFGADGPKFLPATSP